MNFRRSNIDLTTGDLKCLKKKNIFQDIDKNKVRIDLRASQSNSSFKNRGFVSLKEKVAVFDFESPKNVKPP